MYAGATGTAVRKETQNFGTNTNTKSLKDGYIRKLTQLYPQFDCEYSTRVITMYIGFQYKINILIFIVYINLFRSIIGAM